MTTQELIDHTKRLIALPSTSDNTLALQQAVDYVADIIYARCPDVTIEHFEREGKPSLLAYRGDRRPQKFDILLNGHVDVVPGTPEQFVPVVKNGRLYGRGALDMKGTTMVLADVFCELVNEVPYALGLQIVSDEEIGGYSGVRLQIDDGVRADFVVMGEYSNDRNAIYNAARGLAWAEVEFKGKEAHGGHLWKGQNAVLKASAFAAAVLERFPTPDKETWTTTASIASLSTPNDTFNKVPDRAVLKIDFRFTQEDPNFRDRESLKTFIAGIDPEAKLVRLATFEPAVKVEELNPYVQGLSAAMRQVTGAKPRYLGRPGSSDGRHYALVNNDIVEFGLYGQSPHGDDEYAELASFGEYQSILREFLRQPVPAQLKKQTVELQHLTLLRHLVSLPTVVGDFAANNRAIEFIEDYLASRGMHIARYERGGYRSFVATTKPHDKRPKVLLSAHTDVVSASEDEFKLSVKGDRIYGRGVMDMKMAIAGYMALVDSLQDELDTYDFGIMITSDEEVGGNDGVGTLVKDYGYKPGVVVVPDGGENWQLESFCKGAQWIRLDATGKNGHASRPWEGDSAIGHLLKAIQDVQLLVPGNPEPYDTFLSVGTIHGGTTANQIPTDASAMLDVRYGNNEDFNRLPRLIKDICKKHGVKAAIVASSPPCVNDPDDPMIKPFIDIVTRVTGKHHLPSRSFGMTDGRFFSAVGIPCIVIEPEAGNRHKDGEWLSKSGFDQFCVILEEYIRETAEVQTNAGIVSPKQKDIAYITKRLNASDKPAYVWYAAYGAGLAKENFMNYLTGGRPMGASRTFSGCRDKTPPVADMFLSLPYELYFSGESLSWKGALGALRPEPSPSTHTIARAYLITVEQFEDLAAQENFQSRRLRLPLVKAMRKGSADINVEDSGPYDVLLFCGMRDRVPIFSLTAKRENLPAVPPKLEYLRHLCQGLSENAAMNAQKAIAYLNKLPKSAGNYEETMVTDVFDKLPKTRKSAAAAPARRRTHKSR